MRIRYLIRAIARAPPCDRPESRKNGGFRLAQTANGLRAASVYVRAFLGDGMMKQFQHEAEGRKITLVDGAVIIALDGFADDAIHLALATPRPNVRRGP